MGVKLKLVFEYEYPGEDVGTQYDGLHYAVSALEDALNNPKKPNGMDGLAEVFSEFWVNGNIQWGPNS